MASDLETNRAVAHRLVDDIFNHGDMRAFNEIFAEEYVEHNMPIPGIPGTKAGFMEVVLATRRAFPDVAVHIEDMVTEGDLVVFHDTTTAISKGAFLGIPATGQRLEWTEMHFLRIADGQIIEHWNNFDQLGILQQLGAIPVG